MKKYCSIICIALFGVLTISYRNAGPFPKKVKRILFIGNSITYAGKYVTDIETYFTINYPGKHYEFINVGLPSETVSGLSEEGHADGRFPRPDLHERLARVLAAIKPDIVFASYGMNDGIYQPFDEQRFQKFKVGIIWLHDAVIKTGAKMVHLTPPIFDEKNGGHAGYAEVLDRYSEWLLSQRYRAEWDVADIHFPMKKYLLDHRAKDTSFVLAKDGVHPGDEGHWLMAKQVLLYLNEDKIAGAASINDIISTYPNGEKILQMVAEKQGIMKDAWLTAIKHTRPEMKVGLPLKEARIKAKQIDDQIRNLVSGK
ncbi:G-D-S-L family lipolytic protein [Terrimonas sp.]|uniref:SGNH/GDSL hydrolase family protein n=1 Tax=Terrimonas sp. TaxID=1914338 RepID=UPI000D50C88A|nr:SGNH/GDSL hydrolase family protein [Terrimonas sp.]PVD51021.1 G-D-S-L family lipolytic protein [Terrimonas sp.]